MNAPTLTRRTFAKGIGGIVLAFTLDPKILSAQEARLPGSLNTAGSAEQDSFCDGLLDWPHYTRPEVWKDSRVPDVLLSGNHAAIARWRRKQSLGRTWDRRPDLVDEGKLSREDRQLLDEYRREQQAQCQQ